MTKYRTTRFSDEIRRVKIDRMTEHYIWLKGSTHRTSKNSEFDSFHDTWELAHNRLIERLENDRRVAIETLDRIERRLVKVRAMREEPESEEGRLGE